MAWIPPTPLDYFAALVADDDQFPLTEAAASLAQDAEPGLDVQAVLDQFDVLGRALQQRVGGASDPIERVRQLHRYLYRELGLAGNVNHFHSPANSYLHEVLRSRRGIPISLAVIYLELAGQIGLPARGVSFPGHFLLRLDLPRGAALIDPLNGESLTREELVERAEPYLARAADDGDGAWGLEGAGLPDDHLAALIQPATPREIVARMLRNLETLHRREADWPALLQVLHRLVLLQPEDWHWRRERAGVLERLGEAAAAIADLEFVLRHAPAGRVRTDARGRLEALRAAGGPRIF